MRSGYMDAPPVEETLASRIPAPLVEKIVVSPATGRFLPLPAETFTTEGEWVEPGQLVAQISTKTGDLDVRSAFRGWMIRMLPMPGEPVQQGQALFWILPS